MSELDVFESQVRERIRQLDSPNANIRRKAAAWLGEAGDPSAIKRLTQVYENDPNAKVRAAAAYSLGMFRVLQREMEGDDPDPVYELLEDIARGIKYMKVYKQMKMYNDESLNPVLYQQKSK